MGNKQTNHTYTIDDIVTNPLHLQQPATTETLCFITYVATEHPEESFAHRQNLLRKEYPTYNITHVAPANPKMTMSYADAVEHVNTLRQNAMERGLLIISKKPEFYAPPRAGSTCIVVMFELTPKTEHATKTQTTAINIY